MAQEITIMLSDSEAALMIELAEAELPDSTGLEKRSWAEAVAKSGLREECARVKMRQVREAEVANRHAEREDFNTDFPEVEIPKAEET